MHCLDCNKSICNHCLGSHNVFTQDHKIVTIKDFATGQATTEGRFCSIHDNVPVRYYCETEEKQVCVDCVSLNACPTEHKRITLKEAAKKHTMFIEELQKKCAHNKEKFQVAVQECKVVSDNLSSSMEQTEIELDKCKQEYFEKVKQESDKLKLEMKRVQTDRLKVVQSKKVAIESEVLKMEKTNNEASNLIKSGSEHMITHKFSLLRDELNRLSAANPTVPNRSLGYLRYVHSKHTSPLMGYLSQNEGWKLSSSFYTGNLENPLGIAENHVGNVIVTSYEKGVTIFSRNGEETHTFMEDCTKVCAVAVAHDNRCVFANGKAYKGIQFHTAEGKYLSNMPVKDTNDKVSNLNTITINSKDQIIAGLVKNTISIHYADGSLISKFQTSDKPKSVAETSDGDIVCSFRKSATLQLMNYSGSNVKVIFPPAIIKKWNPTYLCCGKGQIFIVNGSDGDPAGVFCFTNIGEYVGCVTTDVQTPKCIALSSNGSELFLVERATCQVKIFQRE